MKNLQLLTLLISCQKGEGKKDISLDITKGKASSEVKPWILPPIEEKVVSFFFLLWTGKIFVSAGSKKCNWKWWMKLSTRFGAKELTIWKHLAKAGILGCGIISQRKRLLIEPLQNYLDKGWKTITVWYSPLSTGSRKMVFGKLPSPLILMTQCFAELSFFTKISSTWQFVDGGYKATLWTP